MIVDKNSLTPNFELRAMARNQLKGAWGFPILVCFLYNLILGIPGFMPYAGGTFAQIAPAIISLVIGGPFAIGLSKYFLKFIRNDNPTLETMFDGFRMFSPSFLLMLLITIFTFLWSLLLIVPGIIASLRYSQAFYILNDRPELSASEALNLSKQMMAGQKGKLFCLWLSFIGWILLAFLSCGIGFLWLVPYMETTFANFYEDLKNVSAIN